MTGGPTGMDTDDKADSLVRSVPMERIQLLLAPDSAHDSVDALGEKGLVHFIDKNPGVTAFHKPFVKEVKMCDDVERRLRFLREEIEKENSKAMDLSAPPAGWECSPDVAATSLSDLEEQLEEIEREIVSLNENQNKIVRQYTEVFELFETLTKTEGVLQKDRAAFESESASPAGVVLDIEGGAASGSSPLLQALVSSPEMDTMGKGAGVSLGYVAGLIPVKQVSTFERILFRVTRGNMLLRTFDVSKPLLDPATGGRVRKKVFVVFFHGEVAMSKIGKVCDSFGANRFQIPEDADEQVKVRLDAKDRLAELEDIIERASERRFAVLKSTSEKIPQWFAKVKREKSVFATMNLFVQNERHLVAEGWTPFDTLDDVQLALKRGTSKSGSSATSVLNVVTTSRDKPPTLFRTNKFTNGFQEIVDAYGIARYREFNPAIISVISFPFLFAIMFGDFGHGIIMTLYALFMISKEKQFAKGGLQEMVNITFQGRYLLLLMGIFATYTGLVYNDCFALQMRWFETRWTLPASNASGLMTYEFKNVSMVLKGPEGEDHTVYYREPQSVYPIGVDPNWGLAANKLTFYNSLKMKMSIVFGVSQMVVGNLCKLGNCLHFRDKKTLFFEFIPEIVFMCSLFGYLMLSVFIKWSTNWTAVFYWDGEGFQSREATPLLDMLVKMLLSPGTIHKEKTLYGPPTDEGATQSSVQGLLVVFCLICPIVLLLVKPLLLKKEAAAAKNSHVMLEEDGEHEEDHFDFAETMIHQLIHTIEYVLGSVSHTASYLRLWALSLAHSQLAEVFWEQVMVNVFEATKDSGAVVHGIALFVGGAIWITLTFAVLMVMESLSAFLHALRLHWVEFQTKFFQCDGYKFLPYAYDRLAKNDAAGKKD